MRHFALLALLTVSAPILADEGMWQPSQMPAMEERLKKMGLEIPSGNLSDLTKHPLNAIIGFGFCTASFVSPEGLVVTNHHCAVGAIQYNSTAESNLLENGFQAKTKADEVPAEPNMRIYVTEEIRDVTKDVVGKLKADLSGRARYDAIDQNRKQLVAQCEKTKIHRCDVYTFHGGLEFYLIKQLEIRDARLVYAPPQGVGNFGGDVDNWMWPRHTGDFSFFRAYVGPNGKPAAFDKKNIPYQPKSWLKIAPKGLNAGDFAMVVGYPGSTNRNRLAEELNDAIAWEYPTLINDFNAILKLVETGTKGKPDAEIKYASLVQSYNNALKNFQGQLEGFGKTTAVADKLADEAALLAWLEADAKRKQEFAPAVLGLKAELAEQRARREGELVLALLPRGLTGAAVQLYRLSSEREKPAMQREVGYQDRDEIRIEGSQKQLERRMDPAVDRLILGYWLGRYLALPAAQRVPELDAWLGVKATDTKVADLDARLDALYAGTKLTDTATRLEWFKAKRGAIEKSDDTFLKFAVQLMPALLRQEAQAKESDGRDYQLRPRFMQALVAFQKERGKLVYADANNSLRVTVGHVETYSPREAVSYAPFTTLKGIREKNTGIEPFNAPQRLLDKSLEKKLTPYHNPNMGSVPVNFLTNLDITGGNSGSPTLNSRGELVGLAFDGNWESVSSNWVFNPALTRCIHVDIRYMLWLMTEVDGANHLVKEMGVGG